MDKSAVPFRIPIQVSLLRWVIEIISSPLRGLKVTRAILCTSSVVSCLLDDNFFQVTRPNSSGINSAPDFLLCLIDHLLTDDQQKAHATILKEKSTSKSSGSDHLSQLSASGTAGQESSKSKYTFSAPTPPALQRPLHDRLPLTLAVESEQQNGGVSSVTLMQLDQENEWRDANRERMERERKRVQFVHVPLAHASRCPCRIAPSLDANGALLSFTTASSTSSALSQSSSYPLFRLAVVVAPTLYSISHCARCAPHSPPDSSPCMRALLTRRPNSMRAFPGCWVVPGGACDATDRSLEHTGTREVHEETGLEIDEKTMQMVSLWEAVFPVIKPISDGEERRFVAKARYLITMFSGEVEVGEHGSLDQRSACTPPQEPSAVKSSPPVCVGCSVSLKLCSTEVDAACWVSKNEIPSLEALATYIHCEDEAALQKQDFTQSELCGAGNEVCNCIMLPSMVTKQYAMQYPHSTQLIDTNSSSTFSSAAATNGDADSPSTFLPARIRSCCLFGLYPNSKGSGVAEGHLVLLSEMNAKGLL